jgi:uncharacterized protein
METIAAIKTDQNQAIISDAFNDFLNGNIAGVINACTEDVVWGSYDNPAVPYGKTYHGKNGVADFFATLAAAVEYKRFEPQTYYADKDSVLVTLYHQATVKATGKTFGHDTLMHFKLREGKIAYFFSYVNSNDHTKAFTA